MKVKKNILHENMTQFRYSAKINNNDKIMFPGRKNMIL